VLDLRAIIRNASEEAFERDDLGVDAHQPEDFGVWLHRKSERDEEAIERLDALFQDRSIKREVEQAKIRHNMTPDAPRRSVESPAIRGTVRKIWSADLGDRLRAAFG
jgi:hypothetical protein